MDMQVTSDEDRETRYHRWLIASWWLMIEDLGWGDSRMATKGKRMTWLEWIRKLLGRGGKVPFESQVNPLDVWSEGHLVGLINIERVEYGLRPVAVDSALTGVAMNWTATQARLNRGIYDHGDFQGRIAEVVEAPAGEIGAVGHATMAGTVAGWMASEGHRAQILTPDYVIAGASRVVSPNGVTYTGCDFAARLAWPKPKKK